VVSQVEPTGQHAVQVVPEHGVVPAGQSDPKTSQVVGFRFELQRQTPLGDPAGQQVASLFGHAPFTQVHVPALHVALTWHRLPQLPQLRELLLVSTHFPPQQIPPAHPVPSGFVFLHLPCLLRFLQGGHFFFLASAAFGATRPRRLTVPRMPRLRRRPRRRVKRRVRASKCGASMKQALHGRRHETAAQHTPRRDFVPRRCRFR
jgi:hypothetical protein